MRKVTLVVDGLWQCLCPAFSQNVVRPLRIQDFRGAAQSKRFLTVYNAPSNLGRQPSIPKRRRPQLRAHDKFSRRQNDIKDAEDQDEEAQETRSSLKWSKWSIAALYSELRAAASHGRYLRTRFLAYELVKERHEKPNLQIYSALILSQTNSDHGSAVAVAELLKELRSENLQPDSSLCHDVLRALAVHPDYILQAEILEYMRQRWYTISPLGEHDIVVGLLADHQYELAMDRIEIMEKGGTKAQTYLLDMMAYTLLENEEVEAAFNMLRNRLDQARDTISVSVWYKLLDISSSKFYYDATVYTWRLRVQSGYLNPPSGICLNVLNTAARHGDTQLATDVFRVLGDRATKFTHEHYEALIEAYATHGDIDTAIKVLGVMEGAKIVPDVGTTRAIYNTLKHDEAATDQAFETVQNMQKSGRKVPTVAFDCIMESAITQSRAVVALEQYKHIHEICADGPTTNTFNVLLKGCRSNKSQALWIASEMRELQVPANELTYDRMIIACLLSHKEDYEDAMRYYIEAKTRGLKIRNGTLFLLLERCTQAVDMRAPEILKDMEDLSNYWSARKWFQKKWAGPVLEEFRYLWDDTRAGWSLERGTPDRGTPHRESDFNVDQLRRSRPSDGMVSSNTHQQGKDETATHEHFKYEPVQARA
ncbi:MAG: hypothetical protein M1820_005188 [Bogoriella megaspora]|nr:MAG: hypothetical protein M1820_005188 [Bogoriella megaspora]